VAVLHALWLLRDGRWRERGLWGVLAAIVAHERAHLAGMAWEEAASFLGLLTLWRSDDPRLRYSAWLSLWLELSPTTEGRSSAVQRDLRAIAAFSRAHRGWEAPAVRRTYSAYLEAHGVTGGTASYSRVADLALILVDAQDREVGHADKWSCHQGEGVLHRAFSIFVFNDLGERHDTPSLWYDGVRDRCPPHMLGCRSSGRLRR